MQVNGYSGQGLTPFISALGASQGGTFRLSAGTGSAASAAFAQDIVRRTAPAPQGESSQPGGAAPAQTVSMEGDGSSRIMDQDLADSLAKAVDFVRGRFGDQAATAFMGLVYKGVGEAEVTEESLGRALLQGVRFLDRNFGFAAGDAAMAYFNQDLNQAMNQYFQNGLNEQFYASTWNMGDQLSLTLKAAQKDQASDSKDVASLMDTLEAMLEEIQDEPTTLAEDLETMNQELQQSGLLPQLAAAARLAADPAATAKGLTLDLTV